jgi:hypothetical protein
MVDGMFDENNAICEIVDGRLCVFVDECFANRDALNVQSS